MSIESLRLRCPHCQEKFHVDLRGIEALTAKPESGTAVCSAAGGDVEQEQAGRSADWQARLRSELAIMKGDIEYAKSQDGSLIDGRLAEFHVHMEVAYENLLSITEDAAAK